MTDMIKPIKTKTQYESALKNAYELMQKDLKPGSAENDKLEVLSILIEKYEDKNYPVPPPNPVEAIKFRMEQLGISRSELSNYLGYKSRVSEVLSWKRKLSLSIIRRLHVGLKIPVESLISEY
jgi:HTH-type transcriptional regulator/antitoxin HigA